MVDFLQMHVYLRALILLALLMLSTVNLCTFIALMLKKKEWHKKALSLIFSFFSFAVLVYFSAMQNAAVNSFHFDDYRFSRCILFAAPVCIVNIAFLCRVMIALSRVRKTSISPSSIKESIDNLPTGLCFSRKNGMVQLVNYQMNKLSYLLTGSDIQNAETFWRLVSEGGLNKECERLMSGEKPEIRFENGSVWSFSRENIDSVVQITATDITDYYTLTQTLEQKNIELKKMNDRLRKYSENVIEVTSSKERLETKVRIHNEFGQALIATHRALQETDGSLDEAVELWKRNISVLRMEAEPSSEADHIATLIKAAESVGVLIEVKGSIPNTKELRVLVMTVATEALTNAVKYADAQKMIIEVEERSDSYVVCFTNDGRKPDSETVTEGGGLSSLRRKIERAGGEMYVSAKPEFALTIKLMKESGETV